VHGKQNANLFLVCLVQESQCRIDIENSRSGEHALRVIRIRGNMQQTQVAQELIRQRVRPHIAETSRSQ
jgi:hypothetical protein